MRRRFKIVASAFTAGAASFTIATWQSLAETVDLSYVGTDSAKPLVTDRTGQPIRASYVDDWNTHERVPLERVPKLLIDAIVTEEDKRFFQHSGVDWRARGSALISGVRHFSFRRGASSISEQVARMITPRPRSLWAKWLEGLEGARLESKNGKRAVLEFYLNQIPYAQRRRGVVQAARHFFNRDLETLNEKEILALAVMIKSPSKLDPRANPRNLDPAIERLARRLREANLLTPEGQRLLTETKLILERPKLEIEAPHFVRFVETYAARNEVKGPLLTTLDPSAQAYAQGLLDRYLAKPGRYRVENGAIILADHTTDEILIWAIGKTPSAQGSAFDAALTPRQPGSSLKPFLYALALERGYTAASPIEDEPWTTAVGIGVHAFRNYSRTYYGWLTLREALANSLNVPAVKIAHDLGVSSLLQLLRELGIKSLTREPSHYGEGLALGNGEVTLFELVQAYAVLARAGRFRELRPLREHFRRGGESQPLREEAATLIGDILSDAHARRLEFAQSSMMDLPVQTAVKSGTSTDFRDAWAFGYNHRYVIGIWLGNMDGESTRGLTGSQAPMTLLRSILGRLSPIETARPLPKSPRLVSRELCVQGSSVTLATEECSNRVELFAPESLASLESVETPPKARGLRFVKPTPGLRMAIDPRIPKDKQIYVFQVEGVTSGSRLRWLLDDAVIAETRKPELAWRLTKGRHRIRVIDVATGDEPNISVPFEVR